MLCPILTSRRLLAAALVLTASLGVGQGRAYADAPDVPEAARDLAWGETLFYFFQRDNFQAITRVTVARQRAELAYHQEEAELVLGGLYLDYGMHDHATRVFETLLASRARPEIRDQAWYYLGRARYERGFNADALAALSKVGDRLPKNLRPEFIDLQARTLLNLDRPAEAASLLAEHQLPGGWRNYGLYNRGVALLRSGETGSGDQMLERVGGAPVEPGELDALRDRANLALGFSRLAEGDAEGARAALDRVSLQSPYATRALLGAGWADSTRGDYKAALGPWTELGRRDPLDEAVQESLLALPYAYAELDAPGRAVRHYERAVGIYEEELIRLGNDMDEIHSGILTAAIRGQDADASPLTTAPEPRYLYSLMAGHEFRAAVEGLRDLDTMDRLLAGWQASMEAFDDMLAAHRQRFQDRRALIDAAADEARLGDLEANYAAVRQRLDEVRATDDSAGLANPRELELMGRIAALEQSPGLDREQRQRVEFLRGVLSWQIHADYPGRLRTADKNLRQSERALSGARAALTGIREADTVEPLRFETFGTRIGAAISRLAELRLRIVGATERQATRIEALAVGELSARQRRVTAYLGQARYALAASYDRAALAEAGQ